MLTPLEIAADCEAIGHAVENGYIAPRVLSNERLRDAIERCIEVENRIPEILASVPAPEDPENQIEVAALDWRRMYIEKQIRRGVRAAKERKAYLASLVTDKQWEDEKKRCASGIEGTKHWFRYWAWALDPRASYMPVQPFVPFGVYEDDEKDFQWQYIAWLHQTIFVDQKSGVAEKARDMGATLGWLLWGTHGWLFRRNFTVLLASKSEDDVDSKKDPDTLFEKVRDALRLHPPQLLPDNFRLERDMQSHMNLANPENGSVLSGQAPTANAGRQKRRTAVLKDESAAWPYSGFPQATSLSAVSNSIFDISSVQGKYNHFHLTATAARANRFVMDWRDHPWKDERWYNALEHGFVGPAMTKETIAQEVDRDYDASQPGKVFSGWEETRICIEWPELLEFYRELGYGDRFKYVDGSLMIPNEWNWARMQDKGETTGHPRMTLYCARPAETWPLSDSIFFFIEHTAPTGADLGTVVTELTERQREFNINPPRAPVKALISHEAKKDRGIYRTEFKWNWQAWDTDYDSGIGNIRLWIKPVDMNRPNPIRPQLKGRSRIYLVCEPGQASLFFNEKESKPGRPDSGWRVSPAKDSKGFVRLRAEMPAYHYPPEEAGKPVQDQRPVRFFDDAISCLRSIAVLWGPKPKPETEEEKLMKRLDPALRPGVVAGPPHSPESDQKILSQRVWLDEFREEDKALNQQGIGPIRVPRRTPGRR